MASYKKNKRKARKKKPAQSHSVSTEPLSKVSEADVDQPSAAAAPPEKRVVRLNQRLIVILAVCSILLSSGMFGLRHFQINRNADILRNRASTLQKEGNLNDALYYLSMYIRFRPDDVDALEETGDLVSKTSNSLAAWQHVYLTYEEVLRRDTSRTDIRRKLVDVAVKLRRYRAALSHIAALGENASKDGELNFLSGVCHEAEGNYSSAVEAYLKSIHLSEKKIDHYMGFALFVSKEADALPLQKIHQNLLTLRTVQSAGDSSQSTPDVADETEDDVSEKNSAPELDSEKVVDSILDLMVRRGQPEHKARLTRATFRLTQKPSVDEPPLQDRTAMSRAKAALSNLDSNADSFLDHTEWTVRSFVPSVIDLNEDQQISQDELKHYYLRGTQLAWLDHANRDIAKCLKHVDPDEKSDALQVAARICVMRRRAALQAGLVDEGAAHLKKAREYAMDGLSQLPVDLRFHLVLSNLEMSEGEMDKAEKHIRDARNKLLAVPEEKRSSELLNSAFIEQEINLALADVLFSRSESSTVEMDEDVIVEIESMIQSLGVNENLKSRVEFLDGRMLFAKRNWHQASLKLEEARRSLEADMPIRRRVDLLLGYCYDRLNNPDAKVKVFRRAIQIDPRWTEGRIRLAATLAEMKRIDEALLEYQAVSGVPGIPTVMAGILLRRELSKPEDRRASGLSSVEKALDSEEALNLKAGRAPLVKTTLLRVDLLMSRKQYQDAQKELERSLETNPEDSKIWSTLCRVALFREDINESARIDQAEKILVDARKKLGNRVEFKLAEIQIAASKPTEQARTDLNELEKDLPDFDQKEQLLILESLAVAYARHSVPDKPLELWNRIAEKLPQALEPRLVLAELSLDDKSKYDEILKSIREIEGSDGPNGHYLEAKQLIYEVQGEIRNGRTFSSSSRELMRASELLGRAEEQRPFWASISHLMGNLEILRGNTDTAIVHYRQALAKGSRSEEVIERLALSLMAKQQINEADQVFRQLTSENPSYLSGNLARLASITAWELEKYDEALSLAAKSAEGENGIRNHIMRAQMMFARGRRGKEVEDLLLKANKNAISQQADLISTTYFLLVSYYSRVNKLDEAETVIQSAKQNIPPNPVYQVPLTLARCYETLHKPGREERQYLKRAEELFRSALDANPDEISVKIDLIDFYVRTGDIQKANHHNNQILASKTAVPEDVLASANRRRAFFATAGGTYSATEKGLELLSFKGKDIKDVKTLDLQARAAILAKRPFKSDREDLILLIEEIARRQKLSSAQRLQLAQLYELTGNWPKCEEVMTALLVDERSNSALLAEFVRMLLSQRDKDTSAQGEGRRLLLKAEGYVSMIQQLEPDSFRSTATYVRFLAAKGQGSQASKLLEEFVKGHLTEHVSQTARDLAESGKLQEALAEVETITQGKTDDQEIGAAIQNVRNDLQQKNHDAATESLDQLIKAIDLLADLRIQTMRSAASLLESIGQIEAAEKLNREYVSLARKPESVVALISFLRRQKRYQEAINLCGKSWGTVSPDILAGITMAIVRGGRLSERYTQNLEQQFRAALKAKPDSNAVQFALADLLDYQGQYDQVERVYRKMIASNATNVVALNNLAFLVALRGRTDEEALLLMKRAIDISGPNIELMDTMSLAFMSAHKPSDAVKTLKTVIAQAPSATKYFHLGRAYYQLNNIRMARQAIDEARRMGLHRDDLHPLEQPIFDEMMNKMAD